MKKKDDGYAGGSRPQYFSISESELDEDMTEEDLDNLFEKIMYEDFQQKLCPYGKNKEKFINWGLDVIKILKEDNEEEDNEEEGRRCREEE